MIPNIIFAATNPDGFHGAYTNRLLEAFEQIGRYGSMALMIVNIPILYRGFWLENGARLYLAVNGVLAFLYCVSWIVFRKRNGLAKALALSVLPSLVFLYSGVMTAYIPLVVFAAIFAVCHVTISCKNARPVQAHSPRV
jgi:hypothetical protein